MKITKSQLRQIIKEEVGQVLSREQEEVNLQELEPIADTIVATVEKELTRVPDNQARVLAHTVISKLQTLVGEPPE